MVLRPSSLNFFGMIGPTGKDFGQFTYHLDEVILSPREYIDIEFNFTGVETKGNKPNMDVQAIEQDGHGNQLDLSLRNLKEPEYTDEEKAMGV